MQQKKGHPPRSKNIKTSMESRTVPKLGIVVPCYNEADALPKTLQKLSNLLRDMMAREKISPVSFILCIDDGSSDATWDIIRHHRSSDPMTRGIRLSRNVGHQNALLAGLLESERDADCVLSLDADLQDDIGVFEKFVDAYKEGCDIVYGIRRTRRSDSWFKRTSASLFYLFMKSIGIDLVYNHADYRLASNRVIRNLARFRESNLFLRGIFPMIGFRSIGIPYDRQRRVAGKTKYPIGKMISLALSGITSLSEKPLRMVTMLGFLVFLVSSLLGLYTLFVTLILHRTVPGWASTVLPIYFLGGAQILCTGIIGEYVGRIYVETKRRPRYIISETTNDDDPENIR